MRRVTKLSFLKVAAASFPTSASLALKGMSEAPDVANAHVRSIARAALGDPLPDVRAQADDVLITLRHANQP
jgi:hypothetical protein